jgi:lipopolysaccharide biosynthesis protein
MTESKDDIRLIAFYLPQFHPIPENDRWWGKGFTEWRNVAKARPLFPGHYQPHLPGELGFYDLRLPEVREAQADLARAHGISGFCYYHYWFNGKELLERPFQEVLASGKPDFPFCLCWANENWTRAWDGRDRHILIEQKYSHEDDRRHIRALLPALRDERYIRIHGKPLFLVYRPENLPEPAVTAEIWREEAQRAGAGDLFLAKVESFVGALDPREIGFDAAVEFSPNWRDTVDLMYRSGGYRLLTKLGLLGGVYRKNEIVRYEGFVDRTLAKPFPQYKLFRCVSPGFDNTPRRAEKAVIFMGAGPESYERWLGEAVRMTVERYQGDDRLVFINAWNEWGEGNHLEPDAKFGRAFLEATLKARRCGEAGAAHPVQRAAAVCAGEARRIKRAYWRAAKRLRDAREILRHVGFRSGA